MTNTKPDVVLSDGREINFDLKRLTLKEYQSMFDEDHPFADEQVILEKVTGIAVAEQEELTLFDHKLLWREFFRVCKEPLRDPNS
jgi:hypothetical protein